MRNLETSCVFNPSKESEIEQRHPHMSRYRFFARFIDMGVYSTIWACIAFFILNFNITNRDLLNLLITVLILLIAEPILLSRTGTTVGKYLMGICVKKSDGHNLTYRQALVRLLYVIFRGYGLFLPFYSIIRLYKCNENCKEHKDMPWDSANKYVISVKSTRLPRLLSALLCYLLVIVITAKAALFAFMPLHRGEITEAQFNENLARYVQFYSLVNRAGYMQGTPFYRIPPVINTVEENGVLTEVYFEMVTVFPYVNGLEQWARVWVLSFVGAHSDANIWNVYLAHDSLMNLLFPHGMWFGWVHRSHSFSSHGFEISYIFKVDGRENWAGTPPDSEISAHFSIRKTSTS